MILASLTTVAVLLLSCDPAFCRTEQVNQDAARALYTLVNSCMYYDCPANWPPRAPGRETCYLYRPDSLSWEEARQDCIEQGGTLVEFDSLAEIDTVRSFLLSVNGIDVSAVREANPHWMWTGLNDRELEGTYTWAASGLQVNKTSDMWAEGEPDNDRSMLTFGFSDEDCVEFDGYNLNDHECHRGRPYVCEFDPRA